MSDNTNSNTVRTVRLWIYDISVGRRLRWLDDRWRLSSDVVLTRKRTNKMFHLSLVVLVEEVSRKLT